MSQVIVTDDVLKDKRERSRQQEKRITVDSRLRRWQRNRLKKKDPITVAIGLASLPIVAVWTFFTACIIIPMKILQELFKALGKLVGGKRSLITNEEA